MTGVACTPDPLLIGNCSNVRSDSSRPVLERLSGRTSRDQHLVEAMVSNKYFGTRPNCSSLLREICAFIPASSIAIEACADHWCWRASLAEHCKQVHVFQSEIPHQSCCQSTVPENFVRHFHTLSDCEGTEIFFAPSDSRAPQQEHSTAIDKTPEANFLATSMGPLDAMCLPRIGLIRLEIDGAELSILRGAEAVLREQRATVVAQPSPETSRSPEAISSFLYERGYRLYSPSLHKGSQEKGRVSASAWRPLVFLPARKRK